LKKQENEPQKQKFSNPKNFIKKTTSNNKKKEIKDNYIF